MNGKSGSLRTKAGGIAPGVVVVGMATMGTADAATLSWAGIVFTALGGLAIFLYGMRLMSEGMRNVLGDRMRALLGRLTRNRLLAVVMGAVLTMVIQSSSATTVMLVGFVQARLMSFSQTLGVILGANVGTTITAQIIAFHLTDVALPIVALGFAVMLLAQEETWKHSGQAVLGFGLLFFGMKIMGDALGPLVALEGFANLILGARLPLLGVLAGALLTAAVQSSSAFTGVVIMLAGQDLLTLEGVLPLVLGANIGTTITAGLAGLHTRPEAKRVAVAHAIVNLSGVFVCLFLLGPFEQAVRWLSPAEGLPTATPRQVANAHTLFNGLLVALALPLTPLVIRLANRLVPERSAEREGPFRIQFLDDTLLGTPAMALKLARAEVVRMGLLVQRMVSLAVQPFLERRALVTRRLVEMEGEVDFLRDRIAQYLSRIGQRRMVAGDVEEAFQLMYAAAELEQIADIVTTAISPRAANWLIAGWHFSAAGDAELREMHARVLKQLARAITLLRERRPEQAERMRKKYKKYRNMEMDYMRAHFQRMRSAVPETLATTEYHQDLMEQLMRIASHATNVARIMLSVRAAAESDQAPAPDAPQGGSPSAAAEDGPSPTHTEA